jgi:hypothetical protein
MALTWSVHQGVWLGLFSRQTLNQIATRQYQLWVKYQDETYNRSGFLLWEREVINQYFSRNSHILVAAAGGGREVVALHRAGYRADGFDCVEALVLSALKVCEAEKIDCKYLKSEPDKIPPNLGIYEGAIIGWGGYMHIQGRKRRIAFLSQIREHLSDSAPILLSFFIRPEISKKHVLVRIIANAIKTILFTSERLETGDMLEDTFDHHFTELEIQSELLEAGFEMICFSPECYGHAVARTLPVQKIKQS